MATAQKGKCIYRVRELESPIHKVFRGLRIEVALPNMAGRKPWTDIPIPSFDRPYRVCQFGDYETWEQLQKVWPKICKAIFNMGFDKIEEYKPEDYKEEGRQAQNQNQNQNSAQIAGIDTDEDA